MKNIEKQVGEQLVSPTDLLFFSNVISITSRINEDLTEKIIENLNIISSGYFKEIIIIFNNTGGNFLAAKEIYETLINISPNIKVIGIAGRMLASSSIVLFQACNERIICRDTKTYFHNPKIELTFKYESGMTSRRESHRLIKKDMDSTDFERNFIIDILKISSNETLSKKGIMEIMNQEKILSPKQILNFGLAEKIMNYKQILDLRMEKETYAYVL